MLEDLDKKKLGQRIKQLRISKGLSQDALCDKLYIDPSMLSNFETGKNAPSLATLIKIINALEVQPNEIFEFEHLIDEKIMDKEFFKIYNSLPLVKKQYLYRLVKFLIELR